MNKLFEDTISSMENNWNEQTEANQKYWSWLREVLANIGGSDSIETNLGGGLPWFTVYNREDLQELLHLAPAWNKTTEGRRMIYTAKVGDYEVRIYAASGAIPPTCKVVTETRVIPAQPERIETIEKIVCEARTVLL